MIDLSISGGTPADTPAALRHAANISGDRTPPLG